MDGAPGYPILNLVACNATYEPGEDPNHIKAAPDCPDVARPWLRIGAH